MLTSNADTKSPEILGNAPKAKDRRKPKTEATPQPLDWLLLLLIVIIGGSSFAMIRVAVADFSPMTIMAGRLWVAAIVLYALMKVKGRKFPPVVVGTASGPRLHKTWVSMALVGLIGNTIPFFLFPWAQRTIDSGLAGVYMAFMPIWTLALAYLFAGEALTRNKVIGFVLGLAGVLILMGPEAIAGAATNSVLAQVAILVATLCYAVTAILARRAPPVRPRTYAAGAVLCAALFSAPAYILSEGVTLPTLSLPAIAAVVGLGVGPSGIGTLFIVIIIRRVGASFMALANYLTPVYAVGLGALAFAERLDQGVFIALAVILAGVFVSQRKT
ncbi:MAG: EamA family transporter [Pseudomonadota bacterium]